MLLHIGRTTAAAELHSWDDWHEEYNRYGTWINSVELLLDETQPTYRDAKDDPPNSIYQARETRAEGCDGAAVSLSNLHLPRRKSLQRSTTRTVSPR